MQAQSRITNKHKCFFYSNGLMDHICPCNTLKKNTSDNPYYRNVQWFNRPSQFNGTLVKIFLFNEMILNYLKIYIFVV